jgi:serine/threonine-protein kinase
MSVVWRADDEVLGRDVAVKVLSAASADDPALRRQIRAEARAAARLRHANVVAVFDYGEFTDAGRTLSYVVMELVDGRSLADMLTGGPLPWRLVVLVGAQIAAALAAAHADGVVHRDVKPANVMVTSDGVKLVDFGISAAVGALDDRSGQLLGTPAYLAPERIEGGPVRPSTDVYALGLLLYRGLSGRMPWDASTVTQMVKAHAYGKPAPLPMIAGLPAAVVRLVSRCLAKQPADRPSSIEVAEVLGELAGLPSSTLLRTAAAPTVALPRAVPRRRGRELIIAAAAAVALVAVGGTWWVADGPSRGQQVAESQASCSRACPVSGAPSAEPAPPGASPTSKTAVQAVVVVRPRNGSGPQAPDKVLRAPATKAKPKPKPAGGPKHPPKPADPAKKAKGPKK